MANLIEVIWDLDEDEWAVVTKQSKGRTKATVLACKGGFSSGFFESDEYAVGERFRCDLAFGETAFSEKFNNMRLAIEEDRMPAPRAGVNPFARGRVPVSEVVCICESIDLFNFGCPSAHGKKCRSA